MILVTKVPTEGTPYKIAINERNLIEVTPKDSNTSWLKYWDGKEVRSAVIEEPVESFGVQ